MNTIIKRIELIDEFCKNGKLEPFRELITKILDEIHDRGVQVSIRYDVDFANFKDFAPAESKCIRVSLKNVKDPLEIYGFFFVNMDIFFLIHEEMVIVCHKSKKLFLLCAFFILCASCNDNEQVNDQSMEIRQLDSLVANKLDFRIKRDCHIANLKKRLHSDDLDTEHQYIINGDITANYFGYQSDSVITYLQKNLVLADSTENNNWRYETLIKKSNLLNSIGLFTESKMILDNIQTDVPKVLLFSYNSTSESLYTNLYEYSRSNKMFYLPYVFTEQGVAMTSAILRTDIAVKVSFGIMEAFVEMRRMLISNAALFHRLDNIELKQLEADQKFEEIFKALESDKLHSEKMYLLQRAGF